VNHIPLKNIANTVAFQLLWHAIRSHLLKDINTIGGYEHRLHIIMSRSLELYTSTTASQRFVRKILSFSKNSKLNTYGSHYLFRHCFFIASNYGSRVAPPIVNPLPLLIGRPYVIPGCRVGGFTTRLWIPTPPPPPPPPPPPRPPRKDRQDTHSASCENRFKTKKKKLGPAIHRKCQSAKVLFLTALHQL